MGLIVFKTNPTRYTMIAATIASMTPLKLMTPVITPSTAFPATPIASA